MKEEVILFTISPAPHTSFFPLTSFQIYLAFARLQPAQHAFPCGFRAKNEEQQSKTVQKIRNGAKKKCSQNQKSHSSVLFCSETTRKRLLRRLARFRLLLYAGALITNHDRNRKAHQKTAYLPCVNKPRGGSRIFLGGDALVSCSTSAPINHIVFFFCRIPVVLENRRSSKGVGGGGWVGCAPPAPVPEIRP